MKPTTRLRHAVPTLLLGSLAAASLVLLPACKPGAASAEEDQARLSMFVGVDVSGSFLRGKYYDNSLDFLAHYLHAHLNGLGGLEKPRVLFVGSLGGSKKGEARTLYPIQTFENKSVAEIHAKLAEIFPKKHEDPYTDFNSFFEQVETTVKNKGLILRPISIVLLSDGHPDFPGTNDHDVAKVVLKPLELLSRNVTIRLLYTDAVTGAAWQNKVHRQRVKVWTQDDVVMVGWKDPKIYREGAPARDQHKLFEWIKDNVDFPVRMKRVD